MIIVSPLIDSYFKIRLKNKAYRLGVFRAALKKNLRHKRFGRILLRNLGEVMAQNKHYHEEFSELTGKEEYQKMFWESDLGYMWYAGNFHVSNKYFNFALLEMQKFGYKSLLDVGCGWGEFCLLVSSTIKPVIVKGIDISEDIIRKAKESDKNGEVTFACEDVMMEKDTYDLVTFFGSPDYISPQAFEPALLHTFSLFKKELILVNSLRGVPFSECLSLTKAVEVKRYDDGFLHPLPWLLEKHKAQYGYTFEVSKYGQDSLLAVVRKISGK